MASRMDQQREVAFRGKLNEMIQELEGEVNSTVEGMRDGEGLFPDPTDRAALESERNLTLRIRDRERKLRKKIEADPVDPKIIRTIRNAGYQFIPKIKKG